MTIYSVQRLGGCGLSTKKGLSRSLECECGWGGGKWLPASTESQKAEWGRATGPHLHAAGRSKVRKSQRLGGAGRGRRAGSGPADPRGAGKQAFDTNVAR